MSAILSEVESRGLPNRRVACTMPKITGKASKSSKGGRRSGRKSGATESSAPGAAQQGASSHSHRPEAVAGGTSPQTSVASLSLEQLMDAVGARVRQELRSQATTPYLSLPFTRQKQSCHPESQRRDRAQRCQFPPQSLVSVARVVGRG